MSYTGYKFQVDAERCIGCGLCESVCLGGCFSVTEDGKAVFMSSVDCIVCGGCESLEEDCPGEAIKEALA